MAEFPALPLFTDAITADTSHLDDDEFGRYVRILIIMWRSPGCRIPNDKSWISKRLRIDALRFDAVALPLLQEFCQCDGNWWTQKRLSKEFEYVKKRSEQQSVRSKSRWEKEKTPSHGNAEPASVRDGSGNPPTPTPHPLDNSNELSTPISPKLFVAFWDLYPRQRRGSKDKALLAYKAALKRGNTEQQIIDGVKTYASSSDVTRGYAKGCAAWLNDDGFNNDYKPVGVQDRSPSGANRGFDALATAAAKISENLDHEAEQLLRENPVLYFQRYGDQSGGTNHIAGSLEAPNPEKYDAALPGIGSNEEGGTNGYEQ